MTLELGKIASQIDDMGRVLAERSQERRQALPAARALLRTYANDQESLRQIAESEDGKRMRCASPGDEVLDGSWSAPAMLEKATLIAADGSQIFPNRHGLAFYYALNIGSIVFRHGSGEAPEVSTDPRLFYHEQHVYPGGEAVNSDLVSAERDLAEMQALADLAVAECHSGPPCLALADGPLLIWLQRTNLPKGRDVEILTRYLAHMDKLRASGATACGLVSRPHSAEVVALLYLAQADPEERANADRLADTMFRGLTDRALFGLLRAGERSALFVRGTAANQDFRGRGHTIYFFYLNTGSDIARVEIPEWVARSDERLELVHATLYDQCHFNNGYPYVLTRADELAVILGEEREALESMITRSMARHGLPLPQPSRKAQQKQVARWRRRH
jgi:hypothetical protein